MAFEGLEKNLGYTFKNKKLLRTALCHKSYINEAKDNKTRSYERLEFLGDSVLGNRAHMGAGSICSNLKSDGKAVVIHGDQDYVTGLRKIGGILADGADAGCGCVINPGTVIGKRTTIYPLTSLRGVYPADCIVKATNTVVERKENA